MGMALRVVEFRIRIFVEKNARFGAAFPSLLKDSRRVLHAGCKIVWDRGCSSGSRFMRALPRKTEGFDAAIQRRSSIFRLGSIFRATEGKGARRRWAIFAIVAVLSLTLTSGALARFSPQDASATNAQSDKSKQNGEPAPSPAAKPDADKRSKGDAVPHELPVGTTICAVLTKTVDAKKAKAGDGIAARATLAVLSHGKVIIADGAKISGHIVKVTARSRSNPQSEVSMVFDHATLKDGGETPLALTVQAIGYGGVPLTMMQADADASSPFAGPPSLVSPIPSGSRHSGVPQSQPISTPDGPGGRSGESGVGTALDVGSKGVVGMPGLELSEGSEPAQGSVVSSSTKNVKLETGSQLILRVIDEKAEGKNSTRGS